MLCFIDAAVNVDFSKNDYEYLLGNDKFHSDSDIDLTNYETHVCENIPNKIHTLVDNILEGYRRK